MDELFGEHPWTVAAVVLGLPPLAFFAELFILAVVA
jgi:hypothetical protein